MPSLFEMLFETMPFAGVIGALQEPNTVGGLLGLRTRRVSDVAAHLRFLGDERVREFVVPNDPPDPDLIDVSEVPPERLPLWGYEATSDPAVIRNVTCRVRSDGFRKYKVLERVEFGSEDLAATQFERNVKIGLFGNTYTLPLTEEFRMASFATFYGRRAGGGSEHWLWPLEAQDDITLLQLFVYDVDALTKTVRATKSLPPESPSGQQVAAFMAACERLKQLNPADTALVPTALFRDDLWISSALRLAQAAAGNPIALATGAADLITLQAVPSRVAVVTSLTPCYERNDYQPGSPAPAARLFPHILVACTEPSTHIDAAVRLVRPTRTSIDDKQPCGCSEMNPEIGSLLVADSNAGNLNNDLGAPLPMWDNLFNYYLPRAFDQLGNVNIPAVRKDGPAKRPTAGLIARKTSSALSSGQRSFVDRVRRQGAFDNIHIAPSMKLPHLTAARLGDDVRAALTAPVVAINDRKAWKVDDVLMAPICPHDCFHMHWRWTGNKNWSAGASGWRGTKPHDAPEAPMVPENQEVCVRLESPTIIVYKARAFGRLGRGSWEPFCHHGTAYGTASGLMIEGARALADFGQLEGSPMVQFYDGKKEIEMTDSWATFYWNMRYYVANDRDMSFPVVRERTTILDLQKLLAF